MGIDSQTGSMLEGGGMRAIFAMGVLDYFMGHNIWPPYMVGVSASAGNGTSYASHQWECSRFSNIDLLKEYNYTGPRHFLWEGGYTDLNSLLYVYPDLHYSLDYDTYFKSKDQFAMVMSGCLTGKARYFEEKKDRKRLADICKASCILPIPCPITYVDGIPMVSGGVCDAIPIRRAITDSFSKNVIIPARNKDHRKEEKDFYPPGPVYNKHPTTRKQL